MQTTLHQPIEGAFFRMSLRHYLTVRGYSRDQAKRLVAGIPWCEFKARIKEKGPNLLTILRTYDFDERPAFAVEAVDFTEFDIDVPAFENLCKENPTDATAQVHEPDKSEDVLP